MGTPEHLPDHLISLRTYRSEDHGAVLELYRHGLLQGELEPGDDPSDLHAIERVYLDRSEDHFWVVETEGRIIGMIGVTHDRPMIARIRRLRVARDWQAANVARRLIEAALEHCRHHGSLKVVLDTHLDANRAIPFVQHSGFQYARVRTGRGKEVLEFYLDLYQKPEHKRKGG